MALNLKLCNNIRMRIIETLLKNLSTYFWPESDEKCEKKFKDSVHRLFDAVKQLERKSGSKEAQEDIKSHESDIFKLFVGHQQEQAHKALLIRVFYHIYPELAKIINHADMMLQKDYFLADLLTIPMDNIHGYFCEKNISQTAYGRQILKKLQQRQTDGKFTVAKQDEKRYRTWLNATADQTADAALQHVYTYFEGTAQRYFDGQTQQLIGLLLDKKERNRRVHIGKKCIQYYKSKRSHCDIYDFLGHSEQELLDRAFGSRQDSQKGTRQEVRNFEKMFKHYCQADVEKWFKAKYTVQVSGDIPDVAWFCRRNVTDIRKSYVVKFLENDSIKKLEDKNKISLKKKTYGKKSYIVALLDDGNTKITANKEESMDKNSSSV